MHIVEKCQELTYKCLSVVYLFKRNKKNNYNATVI